tara:strand:+ start:147 stop:491 length:345 start_codon:yes stop_codon:yes gene_type:complete
VNKLSPQDEHELMVFIKDWLKVHGYSQKDLANELNINSSRSSEILKRIKELYKKGGIYNIAKNLIKIEQNWLNNSQINIQKKHETNSYNQLDIDYTFDIDALMNKMEKDHNINK